MYQSSFLQTLNLWPLHPPQFSSHFHSLSFLTFQICIHICCSSKSFRLFFILYQKVFVTIMFEFWSPWEFASSHVMGRLFLIFSSCSLWDGRFTRCVNVVHTGLGVRILFTSSVHSWLHDVHIGCAHDVHIHGAPGCMMFTLGVSMTAAGPALSAPRLKMGALLRGCVSLCARHFLAWGDQVKPFSKLI